jgi:1-acyl-sn-glycerol-3-phosphate acyltransferase
MKTLMITIFAIIKMTAFLLLCLGVVPTQMLVLALTHGQNAYVVPKFWHKGVCWIFNIRIATQNIPEHAQQTIFVSNHLSYLDIPAIGSLLTASFVAKADVAGWPVFGFLAKLQQTAFISRARVDAKRESHTLQNMVKDGKNLIIFPEGTSTDGRSVRDFKSSLFSITDDAISDDLLIQPFTIKMTLVDGKPLAGTPDDQDHRDIYSWHINMDTELPDHLWRFAKSKGARLEMVFHTPIRAADIKDRKTLAKTCHDSVINGLTLNTVATQKAA